MFKEYQRKFNTVFAFLLQRDIYQLEYVEKITFMDYSIYFFTLFVVMSIMNIFGEGNGLVILLSECWRRGRYRPGHRCLSLVNTPVPS